MNSKDENDVECKKREIKQNYEISNLDESQNYNLDSSNSNYQEKEIVFDSSIITLDDILDKIGITNYHLILYLIVCLSLTADGSQIYLLYLMAPVLKDIYKISDNYISLITSILFIGIALGSISTGPLISFYGRRKVMIISMGVIATLGTFCVFIENILWFAFCRLVVGYFVGILFNLVNSLFEILPSKYRDFVIGSIFFAEKIGIVYFVLIFYIFSINTNVHETYKLMFIANSAPIFLCLFLSMIYLDESPRLLLFKEYYSEAFEVIKAILKGSGYKLSKREFKKLKMYMKELKQKENEERDIRKNLSLENNIDIDYKIKNYEVVLNNEKTNNEKNFNEIKQDYEQNLEVIEKIENNEIKESLIKKDKNCRIYVNNKKNDNKFNIENFNIFSKKMFFLTTIVLILWAFNSITKYSNMYIMPIILEKYLEPNKNNLLNKQGNYLFKAKFKKTNESPQILENSKKNKINIMDLSFFNYDFFNYRYSLLDALQDEIIEQKVNSKMKDTKNHEKFKKILISNIIPIPAEFLAGYLTNFGIFGRKSLIFLGFLFMGFSSIWMLFDKENLYLSSSLINFWNVISYNITKLYTCEVYNTQMRDFAYGMGNFASRFAAICVPFICNYFLNLKIEFSILFIIICCFIGALITILLPFETHGKKIE